MKRSLLAMILLLLMFATASATQITVQSMQVPNVRVTGTVYTLRIIADGAFVSSDGNFITPNSIDSGNFYQEITCSLVGSTLTIPQFTIDSTTNALDNQTRRYFAFIFVDGSRVAPLAGFENGFRVPGGTGLATTLTWVQIRSYNAATVPIVDNTTYTRTQIDQKIQTAIAGAPGDATYITQTENATLTNEFALGSLATGILKNTITTGVPMIAVAGTDYQAPISVTSPLTFVTNTVAMPAATTSVSGYLTSTDWTTFNAKQTALGFTPENSANRNATNGYPGLSSGKITASQIQEVIAPADLTGISGVQGTGATLPVGTFTSPTNGQAIVWDAGTSNWINGSVGAVTSVALATNAGWFTVSGSPVTSTGSLTFNLTTGLTGNQVLATPDGTTGVVAARALVNADLPVTNAAHGGTGLSTLTAYGLIAAGTTSTGNFQQVGNSATAGQVLTYVSSTNIPTWQNAPGAAHALLGPQHTDTTSASPPTRGSIIISQGSGTATWAEKVRGTQYQTVQANANDTVFDAVHLDQAAAVTGTLPVTSGGTGAATFTANAVLYGTGTSAISSVLGGGGTLCLQSTDGAAPVFGACSGSAATAWSSITAPSGNLAVAMSTRSTTFTWGTGLAADAFTYQDTTGSTSTNHIVTIASVGTSTMKPIAICSKGTTDCVEMSAAANFGPIGAASLTANVLNGVSGNGAIGRASAGNFVARTFTDAAGITWTNGDLVSGNPSAALNLATLVANQTIWDGANTPRTLTFAVTGTDPVMSFAASSIDVTTGTLKQGGTPVVLESRTLTNGTGINTLGDLSANRTVSIDQSFAPTWTGVHTFTPGARSSGSAAYLTVNAPTDTNLTADTEAIGIRFVTATRQHADGTTQTNQREVVHEAPTYSAAGTSIITNAATMNIDGAPAAGTNMTLTHKAALWVGNTTDGLLIPNQVSPFIFGVASIKLGYADSTAGNIFQVAGTARNTGSAPVVGVGGFGFGNGASANAFGGNFVGYAETNGANVQGAEIDAGNLVANASGGAHALVLAMYGGNGGTNYMQMQSGSASSEPSNGILFNSTTRTAVKSTGSMITSTGTSTVTNGVDWSSGLTFTGSAFKSPGFAVGPLGQVTVPSSNGTSGVWSMDAGLNTALTIANNGNATPTGNTANFSGLILVMDTTAGETALFMTSSGVTNLISQTATGFSNTLGTASKANLYVDGSFIVHLENKRGSSHDFNLMSFRIRNF